MSIKQNKIISTIFIFFLIYCFGLIFFTSNLDSSEQSKKTSAVMDESCETNIAHSENQFYSITGIAHSQSVDSRPVLPDSFLSSGKHFNIHYATTGKDSVALTDLNNNFIPDRVEQIASAFEKSFSVECLQMNYPVPPSMENGSRPYDIYIVNLSTKYATTITEGINPEFPAQKNVKSYIVFNTNFEGPGFHIQGENAINVTAAHEFFHAIQLGYVFRNTDGYFFELTAVWMEDQVFDEVDNYLYYLDYFFDAPGIPLTGVSYTIPNVMRHIYGRCAFGFYIAENFGSEAIRQIWQLMSEKIALEAIDRVFKNHNTNFENEFFKFCKWNFFTGERTQKNYSYKDASKFPEVKLEKEQIIEYLFEENGDGYFLTSAYFVLRPLEEAIYNVYFSTEFKNHWRLGIIIWDDKIKKAYSVNPGESLQMESLQQGESIVVIPCNINRFANPTKIYFKEEPEEYSIILSKERTVKEGTIKSFQIQDAYPNPFAGSITFTIKKICDSNLTFKIFNINGQLIEKVKIGEQLQEVNHLNWNSSSIKNKLAPGIYFFNFTDGYFSETEKVVLCQ